MANNAALRANFDNFLYDLQGQLQRLFPRDNVLLAELSGVINSSPADGGVVDYDQNYSRYTKAMDGNREHFDGEQVRFPIMTAGLQGGGTSTENGTWNVPIPIDNAKATVKLGQVIVPFAVSLALARDSQSGERSAMSAVEMYTTEAYAAAALVEDVMLHRNGDALLATNTTTDATGLTMTVGTSADFDVLLPGSVYDVLTVSNGTDPGQGKRRRIASVSRTSGTVTFDTTQQASDGGSGNIVLGGSASGTWGIYIPGSYGTAIQGLGQTVTTGGTAFEGIDVANVPRWTATSVDASAAGLTDSLLLNAAYLARGQGAGYHDFGVGHSAAVDKYITSKTPTVYYQPQEATLRSGFSGIVFQGADKPYPIVKAMNAPRKHVRLIRKDALKLYGDSVGPAFIDDDGGMFRFFNRQTVKEADLLDRVQLAVARPNSLVDIKNLAEQY
jgi:hypothetical protein